MSGWTEGRLGDFIELKRGYDLPAHARVAGRYPVVSSSGPSGWNDSAKVAAPGVVTGRYGTLGAVFYVEDDFWPLNTTLYVRDFKGNDPRFVSYFLREFDFAAYSDKAAVPGVNRNALHESRVCFPPLDEQRAIAGVLGALDDKIELNRRMNETLEEIGRARFEGMLSSTCGSSRSLAAITSERSERVGNRSAVVLSAVASGELVRSDDHFTKRVYSAEITKYKIVRQFDYAYNPSRINIGSVGMHVEPELGAVSPVYVVIRVDADYKWFLRFFLRLESTRSLISAFASGSVRQSLTYRDFASLPVVLPTDAELASFNTAWALLDRKIRANDAQSRTLAELRDALLPKLISGELRVRDVVDAVG